MLAARLLRTGLLALALAGQASAQQPNLVLIIADDVGTDLVGTYGVASSLPCTPNLDALASDGLLFRNAWSNALCSASRASLLTGRYAFRHGIGGILLPQNPGLPYSELTLPEMLTGYQSSAIGKWHLSGSAGDLHPNLTGFTHFAGTLSGGLPNYFSWIKVTNGTSNRVNNYAVSERIDDAVAAMDMMQEPWLLMVSFNTIHGLHKPPSSLCPTTGCGVSGGGFCDMLAQEPTKFELARAMVEAMDTEIGRLLAEVEARDPNAYVMFMGDNGTFGLTSAPPFPVTHGKGTLFEGGINIPLIVKGPGVVRGECDGLVGLNDVFATFAELSGSPATAEDSVSMVPYFSNPAQRTIRPWSYSEGFIPNFLGPFTSYQKAVRDSRYKLIRIQGQPDQFFDLQVDPFEAQNLVEGLNVRQTLAYNSLSQTLASLQAEIPITYCTSGTSAAGCQASISSTGTSSASAASGFTLDIVNLEGQRDSMFFYGANGRQAAPWGSGTSLQCVVAPVKRGGLQSPGGTLGLCDSVLSQDLNARWTAKPAHNPGAGAVVQAQFWYRDPTNTSNQTTSLSNALEFTVQP